MFLKDCRCFLCKPHTTKKGKYTAVLLSRFGRVTKTLLSAGTLEEALNACEDRVDEIRFSKKRNVVSHLPVCPDFLPASFFDPNLFEYNNVTNSMPSKARRRSIDYTYAYRDQLEGDFEPSLKDPDDFRIYSDIMNKLTYDEQYIDILSKKEMRRVWYMYH